MSEIDDFNINKALLEMHNYIKNSKPVKETTAYFKQDEYIKFAISMNFPICYKGFNGSEIIITNSELNQTKLQY